MSASAARRGRRVAWAPRLALLPMAATVLVAYLGTMLWTLRLSLSGSRTFPRDDFVGAAQYERLVDNERWRLSLQHLAVYGTVTVLACLVLGALLAIAIDRRVRAEGLLRTVFLYPYAMSMVATGLVWQWVLNPESGLERSLRALGWRGFGFDWIVEADAAIYAVALAAVWQGSGLVMALLLAALRGIDDEIWKAARVDGIPVWRVYVSVALPMIAPALATATLLLVTAAVKVFDVVVAMTQGGPGDATEVPAKFVMDHLFARANLGLASAGAISLLAGALAVAAPLLYARSRAAARRERA